VVEVTVRAWTAGEQLHLQIEDRGQGFESDKKQTAGRSTGLSGMQERTELLGGRFSVETGPGLGTRITAVLPIAQTGGGESWR
jgi:two-component system sensor histidine kinase NreB